jgi:L-fuculose-phosphate aldolase
MYTGKIIGQANTLSHEQVQEVLRIREKLGINAGGAPSRCAREATNLKDTV